MRLVRLFALIVFAISLNGTAGNAYAQNYPSKPIRIIVGFPPGGGVDIVARLLAPNLSELLGQQLLVDNRAGAGGNIGAELLAKSTADGHTLFFSTPSITVNPALYPNLGFDPVQDFAPITTVGTTPLILVVHPSLNIKTVPELIAMARDRPGKLTYSSGGNGSVAHLSGELLKSMAGVNILHVPYKGSPELLLAVLRNETQVTLGVLPSTLPLVKDGKLKGLGVTSLKRSEFVPELPTIAETGVPGYESIQSYGLLAPAKTPQAIIDKLNSAILKAVALPEIKTRLFNNGIEVSTGTPQQFSAFIKSELVKWSKVVKESSMKID